MPNEKSSLSRVAELFQSGGWILGTFRVAHRAFRRLLDRVNTVFWQSRLRRCGRGSRIQFGARIEYPARVSIGRYCLLQCGVRLISEVDEGFLDIGDRVKINENVHIDHTGGLTIGSDTVISEGTIIYSHSHGHDPHSPPVPLPKTIGTEVWIGARVLLLERCSTVGDGSVIGAGAVVAKPVPAGSVAYGNPAIISLKNLESGAQRPRAVSS